VGGSGWGRGKALFVWHTEKFQKMGMKQAYEGLVQTKLVNYSHKKEKWRSFLSVFNILQLLFATRDLASCTQLKSRNHISQNRSKFGSKNDFNGF
jgi:hypothetical protein